MNNRSQAAQLWARFVSQTGHIHVCPHCNAAWAHRSPNCTKGTVRCPDCWEAEIAQRERQGLTFRTDLAPTLAPAAS